MFYGPGFVSIADSRYEFLRFLISGVAASIVHFGVLAFEIEVLRVPSAGLANFIAALCGVTASFLGNRYFVFRGTATPLRRVIWRFALLYAAIACLHAGVLYVWTDRLGFDYRIGFVVATGMQVMLTYLGNKRLVFTR